MQATTGDNVPAAVTGDITAVADVRVAIFSWAYSLVVLGEICKVDGLAFGFWGWLLATVTAVVALLLLRPVGALFVTSIAGMPGLLFSAFGSHSPNIVDRHVFYLIIQTVVIAYATAALVRYRRLPTATEFNRDVGTCVRLVLLSAYFWAGFSKLNSEFTNEAYSCAVIMLGKVVGDIPHSLRTAVIYAALITELSICFVLSSRRTRAVALPLVAGFHLLMGLIGPFSFSNTALSMLCLFLPDDFLARLRDRYRSMRRARPRLVNRTSLTMFAVAVIVVLELRFWNGSSSDLASRETTKWLWAGLAATALAIACIGIWRPLRSSHSWAGVQLKPRRWWQFVVLAVVMFVGMSPYLGVRSLASFAMFSNLRTDADFNHLLVPSLFKVSGNVDDYVEVIDLAVELKPDAGRARLWQAPATGDARLLEEVMRRHGRIPWIFFRQALGGYREIARQPRIVYRRDGAVHELGPGDTWPTELPWYYKLLSLRVVYPPTSRSCPN